MRAGLVVLVGAVLLQGCAKTSVIPLSSDTIQLTAGAAPICGQVGAQAVAAKQAAVETIRRGYDRFAILGGAYQNDVRVVGYTPVVANTQATVSGNYGYANTTVTGGSPIIMGSHNEGLVVKMFKASDPAGANAVDARTSLGPEWKKQVESGTATCL